MEGTDNLRESMLMFITSAFGSPPAADFGKASPIASPGITTTGTPPTNTTTSMAQLLPMGGDGKGGKSNKLQVPPLSPRNVNTGQPSFSLLKAPLSPDTSSASLTTHHLSAGPGAANNNLTLGSIAVATTEHAAGRAQQTYAAGDDVSAGPVPDVAVHDASRSGTSFVASFVNDSSIMPPNAHSTRLGNLNLSCDLSVVAEPSETAEASDLIVGSPGTVRRAPPLQRVQSAELQEIDDILNALENDLASGIDNPSPGPATPQQDNAPPPPPPSSTRLWRMPFGSRQTSFAALQPDATASPAQTTAAAAAEHSTDSIGYVDCDDLASTATRLEPLKGGEEEAEAGDTFPMSPPATNAARSSTRQARSTRQLTPVPPRSSNAHRRRFQAAAVNRTPGKGAAGPGLGAIPEFNSPARAAAGGKENRAEGEGDDWTSAVQVQALLQSASKRCVGRRSPMSQKQRSARARSLAGRRVTQLGTSLDTSRSGYVQEAVQFFQRQASVSDLAGRDDDAAGPSPAANASFAGRTASMAATSARAPAAGSRAAKWGSRMKGLLRRTSFLKRHERYDLNLTAPPTMGLQAPIAEEDAPPETAGSEAAGASAGAARAPSTAADMILGEAARLGLPAAAAAAAAAAAGSGPSTPNAMDRLDRSVNQDELERTQQRARAQAVNLLTQLRERTASAARPDRVRLQVLLETAEQELAESNQTVELLQSENSLLKQSVERLTERLEAKTDALQNLSQVVACDDSHLAVLNRSAADEATMGHLREDNHRLMAEMIALRLQVKEERAAEREGVDQERAAAKARQDQQEHKLEAHIKEMEAAFESIAEEARVFRDKYKASALKHAHTNRASNKTIAELQAKINTLHGIIHDSSVAGNANCSLLIPGTLFDHPPPLKGAGATAARPPVAGAAGSSSADAPARGRPTTFAGRMRYRVMKSHPRRRGQYELEREEFRAYLDDNYYHVMRAVMGQ